MYHVEPLIKALVAGFTLSSHIITTSTYTQSLEPCNIIRVHMPLSPSCDVLRLERYPLVQHHTGYVQQSLWNMQQNDL